MTKLGLGFWQAQHITMGLWSDLFECHKEQHNLEMKKMTYKVEDDPAEVTGTLDDL